MTARDLAALEGEVNHIQAAYPLVGWNTQVRYQKASATGEVPGTLPGYHQAMDWELDQGRFLSNWDVKTWRRVCVIGDKIAEELFGEMNPVTREVKLNGERYTVIGVMKPRLLFGRDWGRQVVGRAASARCHCAGTGERSSDSAGG